MVIHKLLRHQGILELPQPRMVHRPVRTTLQVFQVGQGFLRVIRDLLNLKSAVGIVGIEFVQ